MSETSIPFIKRVILKNYKSIRSCDVQLGPLAILVGPNGSGKSNFLDALQFVAELLRGTVGHALVGHPVAHYSQQTGQLADLISITLKVVLGKEEEAVFEVRFDGLVPFAGTTGGIRYERCSICKSGVCESEYRIENGMVEHATFEPKPPAATDRLYLTIASGFPGFRSVFDFLSGLRFYNIDPKELRHGIDRTTGGILEPKGKGAYRVLHQLLARNQDDRNRVEEYMRALLPGFEGITIRTLAEVQSTLGNQMQETPRGLSEEMLIPIFSFHSGNKPITLPPISLSDGSLRALGVLTALFQCRNRPAESPIPLVGIEEPEATLHPAAAGVLMDALREASHFTQVLVTSHSPELLDSKDITADELLVVEAPEGETLIAGADEASRSVLRDQLYTAGELLRLNQLRPNIEPPETVATDVGESNPPQSPGSQ